MHDADVLGHLSASTRTSLRSSDWVAVTAQKCQIASGFQVSEGGAMATSEQRLLLVDGHSMAYRAFHALPEENFKTADGQATNAVYGFTSMLLNMLRDEKPSHIAVAFDISRETFRSREYPEYKATRSSSPPSFRGQVELIQEVLKALRITVVTAEDFEADDVIATLATASTAIGLPVEIVTGDRDSFQLVSESVTVLYPMKGVSEMQRTTPALVLEKYGLHPNQYADYAALRGDPSDNLPGVPGVGEKTAAKWLQEYGDLSGLLAHVDDLKGKVAEALRAHADAVALNRRLTELVRNVPVDVSVESLVRTEPDVAAVTELFDLLQFRTLKERIPGFAESAASEAGSVEVTRASGDLRAWLQTHRASEVALVMDVDAGGDISAVAVAGEAGSRASAWASTWADVSKTDQAAFWPWFADADAAKCAHDAKSFMRLVAREHGLLAGLRFDTAAAAYVLNPGAGQQSLEDLAVAKAGVKITSAQSQQSLFGDEIDLDSIASSALAILRLKAVLADELQRTHLMDLYRDLEIPTISVLAKMESVGIGVDRAALQELDSYFAGIAAEVEQQAHQAAGREFNLGSPKQISDLLFNERGLAPTKRTKTGFSTDVEALTALTETTEDPIPPLLLRHRDVTKLRQTVVGLLGSIADDGRIHTRFQQFVAATGRLSSTEPNLQNIPVRTSEGQRIRDAFVVGEGFECLLTADYSQIELRIMAHLSGDTHLQRAFQAGEDIHTTVACGVFGVQPSDVDADMRRRVKAMSYGLAYGLSAYGLAAQLGIDTREAQGLMDTFFSRFDKVRQFLADTVTQARERGYTETMAGRRRYLPDLSSDNRQRREMAERMALNAPIQGTAADIVKLAMIAVDRRLEGMASRLLLQVHDELVVEVAPGELAAVTEIVRAEMEHAVELSVPMDVNIGVGRSWHEAAH